MINGPDSGAQLRHRRWHRILTIALVLMILGTIGTLIYVISMAKVGETFTEFYILDRNGKARDYPQEVILGQSVNLTVGIVNREQETTAYNMAITLNGETLKEIGPVSLSNGQKWEQAVAFSPSHAGTEQKVEFLLYQGAGGEPYRTLRLWIDVKNP